MAGGQNIGYVRVSTVEQHTDRQLEGMQFDRIFTDKLSGKDTARPALNEMVVYLRAGDVLWVHSLDRLGRNLDDLRRIVSDLVGKGVEVNFAKEGLRFDGQEGSYSKLMLSMLGSFAEFERNLMLERQREGIAIAKAKGLYKGRKKSLTEAQGAELVRLVSMGVSKATVARQFGVSRATVYEYLKA